MSKQAHLDRVQKQIEEFMECPLKGAATNIVFGRGNADAALMFIGEAPGHNEDMQGKPFVGAAGRELNKLLATIDLTEKDIYIANILKYRPPQNRDPSAEEIRRHTPFLVKQIKVIQPKVLITLGNYSTKFVLAGFDPAGMKKIEGITKLHGEARELDIQGSTYTVVPMYHPAAMLYNPKLRAIIEEDFKKVQKRLLDHKQ